MYHVFYNYKSKIQILQSTSSSTSNLNFILQPLVLFLSVHIFLLICVEVQNLQSTPLNPTKNIISPFALSPLSSRPLPLPLTLVHPPPGQRLDLLPWLVPWLAPSAGASPPLSRPTPPGGASPPHCQPPLPTSAAAEDLEASLGDGVRVVASHGHADRA